MFSINDKGARTELLYGYFFKIKFAVPAVPKEVKQIKAVPVKIVFNEDVCSKDFIESERMLYKLLYYKCFLTV